MLKDWIELQNDEDQRPEPTEALASLWAAVSSASEAQIQDLLAHLMDDPYSSLVSVPLYDSDATELLVRIIDRLDPDPEQADMLERRFPLTWEISVMDAEAFDVRVLLNGLVERPVVSRTIHQYSREELRRSHNDHEQIIASLAHGDSIMTEALLRSHIMRAYHAFVESWSDLTQVPDEGQ